MTDHVQLTTPLCGILGCDYPVLQAGMGGVARSDLVAAVAKSGAYGFLGMVRESPELIAREIDAVRTQTDRNFGVNLIPAATDPALLDAELAVCLEKKVHSLCLFWDIRADVIARAKASRILVIHQVGSVADAIEAERAGADIVIAQGFEAGGHVRGTVSTLVLVPQVVAAVTIPVIAAGGIATGGGLVAALALGAQGALCGTAFLATKESFAHDYHKDRIVRAKSEDAVFTDAFAINWPPHSPVRVIANSVVEGLGGRLFGFRAADQPRQAIAVEDGRPIYKYSTDSPLKTTMGLLESMALFAGQISGAIHSVPSAAERVEDIVREARLVLGRLQQTEGEVVNGNLGGSPQMAKVHESQPPGSTTGCFA